MIFILWFSELFQLSAPLCYILPSVTAENLFYHWIYCFTGPITLVPGCFSIAENTSLQSSVTLTICHSHERIIVNILLFLKYMKSGLMDTCDGQVKCPIQQCPAIPNWGVHNWFLTPCCSSTYCSDSDSDNENANASYREFHGIMFQPHKTLKIVTIARNEKNLVMKVQKSKGCWWYSATTEQAHTGILCWPKLAGTTSGRDLQRAF